MTRTGLPGSSSINVLSRDVRTMAAGQNTKWQDKLTGYLRRHSYVSGVVGKKGTRLWESRRWTGRRCGGRGLSSIVLHTTCDTPLLIPNPLFQPTVIIIITMDVKFAPDSQELRDLIQGPGDVEWRYVLPGGGSHLIQTRMTVKRRYDMRHQCQEILPGLLLGPFQVSKNLSMLKDLGISHMYASLYIIQIPHAVLSSRSPWAVSRPQSLHSR